MSETTTLNSADALNPASTNTWDAFWFTGTGPRQVSLVRGLLSVIAVCYFASSWGDADFWFTGNGPLSSVRVATFLKTANLENAATWIWSPLFLTSAPWAYRLYLGIGMSVAWLVIIGRGGAIAGWALWLMVVGWANRTMFAGGLFESLLSLGLFASAIAPSTSVRQALQGDDVAEIDWRFGFSERMVAAQVTLIGLTTFITMLSGRVWFNGLGSYAVAAPAEDRTFDWTGTVLSSPLVHESLTHFMLMALPVGFALAWRPTTNRMGQAVLIAWCIAVALLGSHWLYACTFATMVLAIRRR